MIRAGVTKVNMDEQAIVIHYHSVIQTVHFLSPIEKHPVILDFWPLNLDQRTINKTYAPWKLWYLCPQNPLLSLIWPENFI